ncbi:MAG: hypothetical protein WCI92_15465 [Bacteroidota bacterium]
MGSHIELPFQAFWSGQSIPLFGLKANKKVINVIIFIYINMLNISWHKYLMQNRYDRAFFGSSKQKGKNELFSAREGLSAKLSE